MKRKLLIALVTAGVGTTIALMAGALLDGRDPVAEQGNSERHDQMRGVVGPQPDTTSPNWKFLSGDVGVLVRDDERFGLRGRLYVRVEGVWRPVATDGPADVVGTIPAR